jgi:hypothetical protein
LRGVALGKGEDSFEAISEILASSAAGDQAWDAEVLQIPRATCLVEVLEEREGAIACQEIHQVAENGVHSVKDASAAKNCMWLHLRPQPPRSATNPFPEHQNAQSAGTRRVSAL